MLIILLFIACSYTFIQLNVILFCVQFKNRFIHNMIIYLFYIIIDDPHPKRMREEMQITPQCTMQLYFTKSQSGNILFAFFCAFIASVSFYFFIFVNIIIYYTHSYTYNANKILFIFSVNIM